MSTAMMQVMACQLPIIASDVKGINNMITHRQNGILVPIQDAPAMAKAIDEIYNNKELRNELAYNGYSNAVKFFSNERMWNSYKNEFDNC